MADPAGFANAAADWNEEVAGRAFTKDDWNRLTFGEQKVYAAASAPSSTGRLAMLALCSAIGIIAHEARLLRNTGDAHNRAHARVLEGKAQEFEAAYNAALASGKLRGGPIETAPKTGCFDAWRDGVRFVDCYQIIQASSTEWIVVSPIGYLGDYETFDPQPTHWTAIPTPPATSNAGGEPLCEPHENLGTNQADLPLKVGG